MADIARLEEVLGFIESHPELHNQNIWMNRGLTPHRASEVKALYPELSRHECGSQGCIAGWGVALWGNEQRTKYNVTWHHDGMDVFGLTLTEADILFHSRNSVEDLRQMVKDMANGLRLEDVWKEVFESVVDVDGDVYHKYFYQRVDS